MKMYCYPRCTTCKKALEWLDEHGLSYDYIDIKQTPPSIDEIRNYHQISGLDIKKFYNTSGKLYRENNVKELIKEMNLEEQYKLLASDGMLIKRPLLVTDKFILLGFKEDTYDNKFNK